MILAALITALAPSPRATAEGTGWEACYEAGLRAMRAGDHDKAVGLMKQSVAAAEKLGTETPEVSRALAGLSEVYLAQERTTEAGLLLERSLYILAKAPGANPSDLARVCESLSRVRVSQEKYPEAVSLLKQVLAIREKTLGTDHPDVAGILERLAGIAFFQKNGLDSVPWERRALEIRVKAAGDSPPKLVKALFEQADFERWHDNEAGAEALRKRALAVQERSLGADHPDVATTLMRIVTARMEMHEDGQFAVSFSPNDGPPSYEELRARMGALFRENEPLVKRALAIREKAFGAEHPDTVQAIQYLASGYPLVGDDARAAPYLRRASVAREKRGSGNRAPGVGSESRQSPKTP
jgi:tetratricopeptide (TPR) repeat protein